MRAITRDAISAITNNYNFNSSNTVVECNDEERTLKLHGNTIIRYTMKNGWEISSAGWETTTTKERLNGLLDYFNKGKIYQKSFVWYLPNGIEFDGWVQVSGI